IPPTPRVITRAITPSTSRGMRSRATVTPSPPGWIVTCSGSPITRRCCVSWASLPEALMSAPHYTRDEMMTVTAARQLHNGAVSFVGIGLPSAACNLARLTHAPDLVLIYESGTVGTRPIVLPLSIGDGELADTATCIVPLPEIFAHYLQRGRIDVGFLGAAQIDRFGN